MGVSENSVPLNPMVFMIIIPMKNGYFIGNINPTFSGPNPFSSYKPPFFGDFHQGPQIPRSPGPKSPARRGQPGTVDDWVPGLVNIEKAIENGHRNSGFSWIYPLKMGKWP